MFKAFKIPLMLFFSGVPLLMKFTAWVVLFRVYWRFLDPEFCCFLSATIILVNSFCIFSSYSGSYCCPSYIACNDWNCCSYCYYWRDFSIRNCFCIFTMLLDALWLSECASLHCWQRHWHALACLLVLLNPPPLVELVVLLLSIASKDNSVFFIPPPFEPLEKSLSTY